MKAMILRSITDLKVNNRPLELVEVPIPALADSEILLKISACGVCRTELDEIEGRTPPPHYPIILGHQIIGRIVQRGSSAHRFPIGQRVGIAWINSACGHCQFCLSGQENLCLDFRATGRDVNGGYAEYTVVHENFAYAIPEVFKDEEAAPLLCAGAVGYRSLKLTKLQDGENIGFMGFGASAHIVMQLVRYQFPRNKIFVFSRSKGEREFAKELGAYWAGRIEEKPPEKLSSVIDTTPAWKPVIEGLKNLQRGGRLVINAIRKEEQDKEVLADLNYERHLWMEKEIKSVANVTRQDVEEFLQIAASIPLKPEIQVYNLEKANEALFELKEGKIRGAKVLKIS